MSVENVKVKFIRQKGYDNLEKWMDDPNNEYIGRPGVVFIDNKRFPAPGSGSGKESSFVIHTKLRFLKCNYNLIKEIHNNIGLLKLLIEFQCSHNLLEYLPKTMESLCNLKYINISHNNLTILPEEVMHATELREIICDNNLLSELPTKIISLSSLQHIEYYNNKIDYISPNIKEYFEGVKCVNVREHNPRFA